MSKLKLAGKALAKVLAEMKAGKVGTKVGGVPGHVKDILSTPSKYYGYDEKLSDIAFKRISGGIDNIRTGHYDPFDTAMTLHPKYHHSINPGFPNALRHELSHHRTAYNLEDPISSSMGELSWKMRQRETPYNVDPEEILAHAVGDSKKPLEEAYNKTAKVILLEIEKMGEVTNSKLLGLKKKIHSMLTKGLLSSAGASALLHKLDVKEAEASPAGVFEKAVVKGARKVSSSAEVLIGRKLEGKTITNVLKEGKWRKILFDDDTMQIVTPAEVNSLIRKKTTKSYLNRFKDKEGSAKTRQALRSLKMREAHYDKNPFITKKSFKQIHKAHQKRIKSFKENPPDSVFVDYEGKFLQMPREYAEHLEELGILTIKGSK
jgi:hypothetical protein